MEVAKSSLGKPKSQHILVVDDDEAMRVLLPRVLRRRGFEVSVADTAAAAETALEKGAFDAAVVDLQMPGRDGFSLARAMQTRWPSVRIIFVSAYDTDAIRKKAGESGGAAFLAKPIGVEELIGHLKD